MADAGSGGVPCPSCGAHNRAGARFCDRCGERLSAAPAPAPERAERRQVSVVFCDLVGSTALSRSVDPEVFREVVGRYQKAASAAVTALGGHTALFLGDGILTYFGYPEAHEDDVERAVRAALEIVDAVRALDERGVGRGRAHAKGEDGPGQGPEHFSVSVRVAVHTGEAVVGDLDVAGAGIFGDTPNIAARLQDVAPPDGVVMSDATHRLTRGLFRVEDLGEHVLTGVDRPLRAYHVLGPSGVRSRFSRETRDRGPLLGRDLEARVLWRSWDEARTDEGRAVLVLGEAGVGKSRLVEAFHRRLSGSVHTWLECAGTPYTRDSAFAAVIELQRAALRFEPDQTDAHRLAALEAAVGRAGMAIDEAVPVLARLHSLVIPDDSPHAHALDDLGAEVIRARTKAVAGDWLLRIGRQQAVVLLVEDLHWLDPSSVELLGEILQRLSDTRALLILTARPEFQAPWPPESHRSIALTGLDADAARGLVRSIEGADRLGDDEVDGIVARTDGVPLFIEEMTRAAVERALDPQGTAGSHPGVPDTLKGLLMARIDGLGPDREVAQVGSILGREFDYALLRDVWNDDAQRLDAGLDHIVAEEIASRTGNGLDARYAFRHALLQEAAYESLLKTTRRTYHARIGEALEARFPAIAETRPELVAHHFSQASRWDRALPLWARAGERAAQRSANVEAERHLRAGLACVESLPEGPERLQQELLFRTRLGANLISLRGYGAEEVAENVARAEELCALIGPSPLLFPVLYNVWVFHLVRSDPATNRLSRDLLTLAEETDPGRFLPWAHITRAITSFWEGNFEAARRHAAACREHYTPDPQHLTLFGDDPGAYGFLYQGLPLWFQGFPEQSRAHLEDAIETAREFGYAFTVAGIHAFRAQVGHFSGRPELASGEANAALAVSSAEGFPLFTATALAHAGWSQIRTGAEDEGLASVERGMAIYRSTGARLNLHYLQSILVEGHLARGDIATGLDALENAFHELEQGFDRYFAPELHRLKGELLARANQPEAAGRAIARALETAAEGSSRMLELRAAVSAYRLEAGGGNGTAGTSEHGARDRLARVYGQFTEGFDEPDLEAARRALEG